jgi:hypothetical protein
MRVRRSHRFPPGHSYCSLRGIDRHYVHHSASRARTIAGLFGFFTLIQSAVFGLLAELVSVSGHEC